MKILSFPNRGIQRITTALERYRPSWDADITIIPVIGRLEHLKRKIAKLDGPYALIQLAVRSTMNPKTDDWIDLWQGAVCVWSYYDLPALMNEDGIAAPFNFYHAPLGIDEVFYKRGEKKDFDIVTHGTYLTEGVRECIWSTSRVAFLGHVDIPHVSCFENIGDNELAELYSRSRYVSGLRRVEGFELPAVEGLACGSRPVLFDREHYRQWYGDLAMYVPEEPREGVIRSLAKVFAMDMPVTEAEIVRAKTMFNWERIVNGFYEHVKTGLSAVRH